MPKEIVFTNGDKIKVGTMYCIGKNYAKHAAEMGGSVPKEPIVFLKPPTAMISDGESIVLPDFSDEVHHEVELAVIIGRTADNVPWEKAKNYIKGYAVGVDATLRDVQRRAKNDGKPWAVSKGFKTSAPLSKAVPIGDVKDEFFDLELRVNGESRQKGSTRNMERSVETLIEYLSKVFILEPGDVIFTGTPEGVGLIVRGDELEADLVGYVKLKVNVE